MSGTSQPRNSPSRAATLASEPSGLRPMWPKMICFQPRSRPNCSVSFIERRRMSPSPILVARLGVDVAAHQHGRAARQIVERAEAGNCVQIVGQRQIGCRRSAGQQSLAPGLNILWGNGH